MLYYFLWSIVDWIWFFLGIAETYPFCEFSRFLYVFFVIFLFVNKICLKISSGMEYPNEKWDFYSYFERIRRNRVRNRKLFLRLLLLRFGLPSVFSHTGIGDLLVFRVCHIPCWRLINDSGIHTIQIHHIKRTFWKWTQSLHFYTSLSFYISNLSSSTSPRQQRHRINLKSASAGVELHIRLFYLISTCSLD